MNPPTLRGLAFRLFSSEIPPPLPPSRWTPEFPWNPGRSRPEPAGAARSFPERLLALKEPIFTDVLTTQNTIEKSMIFQTSKNQPKWMNQSNLGGQCPFWHQKALLLGPFNIDFSFFFFFRKGRKCEISKEYNAKRGSEPSKNINGCIIFHMFFMFFPNPLPEVICRGTLCRSRPKS